MSLPAPTPLLPCPFCGAVPRQAYGKVGCLNKDCKVRPKIVAWWCKGHEAEAAAEWNTRALANEQEKQQ